MTPPTKTPRLRLRLVNGNGQKRFTAGSFEAFRERLKRTGEALEHDLLGCYFNELQGLYSNVRGIHVGGPHSGERYYWLGQTLRSQEPRIGAAEKDPSASLAYFPNYDLHLAVTEAGAPRRYIYSFEGAWMMCQINWLQGQDLSHTCDPAVGEMIDDPKTEREEDLASKYRVRVLMA